MEIYGVPLFEYFIRFLPSLTYLTIILLKHTVYKNRAKDTRPFNGINLIVSMVIMIGYFVYLGYLEEVSISIYIGMTVTYYIGMIGVFTMDKKMQVLYSIREEDVDETGKISYVTNRTIRVPFSKFITGKAPQYIRLETGLDFEKGSVYKLKLGEFKN